jgi:competence protein ComEC
MSGAVWHDLCWFVFPQDDIGRFAPLDAEPACIMATVLHGPEHLPSPQPTPLRAIPGHERTRIEIEPSGIRDGKAWLPAAGRCELLVDGQLLGIHAGDKIQIFGQLERPPFPMNPGEYDFAGSARADRRLATLRTDSPSAVTVLQSPQLCVRRVLDAVRNAGILILNKNLPANRASLAAAMLLGVREALPSEETMPFFLTGTIHLLVVSGLNVGILAAALYGALRTGWLSRRAALAVLITAIVAYVLLTGARPPAVRAGLLILLTAVAAWSGRRAFSFNSLAAAALVVLAFNPCDLFLVGPQLGFLCVAAIICVGARWQERQRQHTDPLDQLIAASRPSYVRWPITIGRRNFELLVMSCVVWFAALPLVMYQFHIVAWVALVLSPLVWPLAWAVMLSGAGLLLCGWLIPSLVAPVAMLCDVSLAALERLVNWAATIRAGHFWTPGPAWWWVLGFYLGLAALLVWGRMQFPWRWQVALTCTWILVGVTPPVARACLRDDTLRCSFVAVGHGTCAVLQIPDGETILYDAGTSSSPEFGVQTIAGFLWDRGITRIDGIVLSHADTDHYNAIPGLLDRFHVGAVYVSTVMFDSYDPEQPPDGPAVLHQAIDTAGVPIHEVWSGDRLKVGREVVISVLHPPARGIIGTDNANSVTLGVEYCGKKMLLPGDLESPGLDDLMAEEPYDCDVLMAPHHGSRRSDPPGFAAWCTPEWVVFSGDSHVPADVERTYARAGARVFTTGKVGAVEVSLGDAPIQVLTWLTSPMPPRESPNDP